MTESDTMKKEILSIINIIRQYKWNSIFYKNLKNTLIMVFLPFLIIVSIFAFYYRNAIITESTQSATQNFSALSNRVESIFKETEKLYMRASNSIYISVFLSSSEPNKMNFNTSRKLSESLSDLNASANSNIIDSIIIYSNKNKQALGSPNFHFYNEAPWDSSSERQPYYAASDISKNCFSICYTIKNDNTDTGLVIFNINPEIFENLFISTENKYSFVIMDSSGQKLYRFNDSEDIDTNDILSYKKTETFIKNQNINIISPMNNIYMYFSEFNAPISLSGFVTAYILCILATFLIVLILALIITANSYHSVENIVLALNKLENNSFEDTSTSEVTYICSAIMNIHEKNLSLEAELLQNFTVLKQLQISTLQMQFTPHFLFNTLNALNLVIMRLNGFENPASKIIVLLSELLQESLHTSTYLIPISDEIENSQKYIEIEKIKSKNEFDLILDIDPTLINYMTVKFSLQPIIENAFKHGIKYLKDKDGAFIKIKIHEYNEEIIFEISNNGPAISSDELERLQNRLKSNIIVDKHIGLCNINKRINLIFGENYGCNITSSGDITTVVMNIPKVTSFPNS